MTKEDDRKTEMTTGGGIGTVTRTGAGRKRGREQRRKLKSPGTGLRKMLICKKKIENKIDLFKIYWF